MLQLIDVLLQMCIPCGTSSGQWCLDPPALCCSQHYYQLVCTVINHLHMQPIWSLRQFQISQIVDVQTINRNTDTYWHMMFICVVGQEHTLITPVSVSSHSIRLIELVNAMKRIQKQNNYPSFTFHIPSMIESSA